MLFDTAALCNLVQNKIKEEFDNNEIININNFYSSNQWEKNADRISEAESKYGVDNIKFHKIICESLEKYIVEYVELNKPSKLLVMIGKLDEDSFSIWIKVAVSSTFFAWLSQFGSKVKVLSPNTVIEQYKGHLSEILNQYIPDEE